MKRFELPRGLLVAVYANSAFRSVNAIPAITSTSPNTLLPSTGAGSAYASSCIAEQSSYTSALASWNSEHNSVTVTTVPLGGDSYIGVDFIANATTLCDGHPRVTWDNPVTLSSGTITQTHPITGYSTETQTVGKIFSTPFPSCSILPSDCDPFWEAYSSSLKENATTTFNPPLTTPPCYNQSFAQSVSSVDSKIYGCGKCTIYGTHVQLVYWPVPTSDLTTRDYCASTPTANVTSYNNGAVISAYHGKSLGNYSTASASSTAAGGHQSVDPNKSTITADGHAFTQGTAYISIGSVWAVDRCSKTFGTVTDAILALPSSSVLSLRYSQDHFQRLMETDKITGYPVNYGDFHTPIPWSAWNGMNQCSGAWGGVQCDVIDERSYLPQLAIPPQITELSPDFEDCQMWYNGLFDPPLALTEAASADAITNPWATATTRVPVPAPIALSKASSAATPTNPWSSATATAEQNTSPSGYGGGSGSGGNNNNGGGSSSGSGSAPLASYINSGIGGQNSGSGPSSGGTASKEKAPVPSNEPWSYTFTVDGQQIQGTGSNNQCVIGTVTCQLNGPAQTVVSGVTASYGSSGVVFSEQHVYTFPKDSGSASGSGSGSGSGSNSGSGSQSGSGSVSGSGSGSGSGPGDSVETITATFDNRPQTIVQSSDGGAIVIESYTLIPGGDSATLKDGETVSAASNGLIVVSQYTVGASAASSTKKASSSNGATTTGGSNASPTSAGAASASSSAAAAELFSAHGASSLVVGLFVVAVLGA